MNVHHLEVFVFVSPGWKIVGVRLGIRPFGKAFRSPNVFVFYRFRENWVSSIRRPQVGELMWKRKVFTLHLQNLEAFKVNIFFRTKYPWFLYKWSAKDMILRDNFGSDAFVGGQKEFSHARIHIQYLARLLSSIGRVAHVGQTDT